MTKTAELLPMPKEEIAVYSEFKAQLAELKKTNAATVFDYESKEGNKAARSYVFNLRKTKTAVDNARKEEKAASLEYGRRVDAEAKEIINELQEMIDVHQSVIDKIEAREKERIQALEYRFSQIVMTGNEDGDLPKLKTALDVLNGIDVSNAESWQEFYEEAVIAHQLAVEKISAKIATEEKNEADRIELARLRQAEQDRLEAEAKAAAEAAEKAEQERIEKERIEREAQIAKEAAEKALKDAEERAEAERQASAQREQEAKDAVERAERERIEAEERAIEAEKQREADRIAAEKAAEDARIEAERQAAAAVEAERKRVEAENERIRQEEAKRRADAEHRQTVIDEAVAAVCAIIDNSFDARTIVNAIVDGNIPHITIKF